MDENWGYPYDYGNLQVVNKVWHPWSILELCQSKKWCVRIHESLACRDALRIVTRSSVESLKTWRRCEKNLMIICISSSSSQSSCDQGIKHQVAILLLQRWILSSKVIQQKKMGTPTINHTSKRHLVVSFLICSNVAKPARTCKIAANGWLKTHPQMVVVYGKGSIPHYIHLYPSAINLVFLRGCTLWQSKVDDFPARNFRCFGDFPSSDSDDYWRLSTSN